MASVGLARPVHPRVAEVECATRHCSLLLGGCPGPEPEDSDTDSGQPHAAPELVAYGRFGGSGYDLFHQFAPLADGGFYGAGGFQALASFFPEDPGGGELVAAGDLDVFVSLHDASGAVQWVRTIGGPGLEEVDMVRATPDGGVIACGLAGAGATAARGEDDAVDLGTTGPLSGFAVQFDASGNLVETWTLTSPSQSYFQKLWYCELDDSGALWLGGIADGEATLTRGSTTLWSGTTAGADSFFGRFGSNPWLTWMDGAGDATLSAATRLTDGSWVVAGGFVGAAEIGEGSEAIALTAHADADDAVLARLGGTGVPLWAVATDSAEDDLMWGLATGPSGRFAVTGRFAGSVTLPGTGGPTLTAQSADAYVAVYESTGEVVWARQIGGPEDEQFINAVAMSGAGEVFVNGTAAWCGSSFAECSSASGAATDVVFAQGEEDEVTLTASHAFGEIATAAFEPGGSLRWAHLVHTAGGGFARGIAHERSGSLLIGGEFAQRAVIGQGETWETTVLPAGDGYDGLWMRVIP